MFPEFCWHTVHYAKGHVTACIQPVHFSALIRLFVPSLLHGAHRCTELLSQSVLCSTFPLAVAPAIAPLMQPHGHNRGIMGAVHMVHPSLCQSLSWGGKLLIPGVWKACVGWISTNKHSTQHSTQTHTNTSTCTHINKQYKTHTLTRTQKRWSLSHSDRFHSATLYRRCGMWGATMAFDTSHRQTTMTSNFGRWLTTMGLSLPQSLCYSSAWSLRQSSVTEVPIELEQSLTKEALTWCFQPSCQLYRILGSVVWR